MTATRGNWRHRLRPLAPAVRAVRGIVGYGRFVRDYFRFRRLDARPRFRLSWRDRLPIVTDWTATTPFDRHYIYHPAWAARILARRRPAAHVDISSTLAFCSLVSAFLPVEFYDYRPADLRLPGLTSRRCDLLALPFADRSIASLSCMHVVEHVGLGRYGDPLDPEGDLKAMRELARVLATNGDLLFVVPVGRPRIQYNAHRVYAYRQVLDGFSGLRLANFSLVPDDPDRGLEWEATEADTDAQVYGCGCFHFTKPA